MGRLMGIEPTNTGATILCLNRLTTVAIIIHILNLLPYVPAW